MLHKEFWGIIFLAFVGWVFLAGTPEGRIKNGCRPLGWTGNVIVSMSALVIPDQQQRLQGYFDKFEYSCQYLNWRLFYQDEYNRWLESNGGKASPVVPPEVGPQKEVAPEKPAKAEGSASTDLKDDKE